MKRIFGFILVIYFLFCNSISYAATVTMEYPVVNAFGLDEATDEAIKILENSEKSGRHLQNSGFIKAVLYGYKNDAQQAKNELLKAIKKDKTHFQSYLLLGFVVLKMQMDGGVDVTEEAFSYFRMAIKYAPKEPIVYNSSAAAYVAIGKYDEAISILEDGIKNCKANEALYYNESVVTLYLPKSDVRRKKIEVNMRKAIELSPNPTYYYLLGFYYLENKNDSMAAEIFNSLLNIEPRNILAMLGVATTYKNMHEYEKAIELVKKALDVAPDDELVRKELKEYEEEYSEWKKKR